MNPTPYPTEHIESSDCPCGPKLVFVGEDGAQVWVHRDLSSKEHTEHNSPTLN